MSGYQCPVCHRPMMGPDETCGGSFTEADHPSGVRPVPVEAATKCPRKSASDWAQTHAQSQTKPAELAPQDTQGGER